MDAKIHKVIIIGSGPAGYTAAIYTARASLQPILFSGTLEGGQLSTTTEVENYPGFEKGIMGPELMDAMKNQALRFGTEFKQELITKVDISKKPFSVATDSKEYLTDSIIVATGATSKLLGLAEEKELMGYGVSTCATCDGAFCRDKIIAVCGGGDSACEEANFLSRFGSKVYLIHRRDELRASKIMQEKVFKNEKIEVVWDTVVKKINGTKQSGVTSLDLENIKTGEVSNLECQAIFVAIGHIPNSEIFKGLLELDTNGYIVTKANSTKTNIEGVFACGDVQDHVFRQAVTAAGSGCMAALEAERYLESLE